MPKAIQQEDILTQSESVKVISELRFTIAMQQQVIDRLEISNSEAWNRSLRYAKEVDAMTQQAFNSPYCLPKEKEA